MLCVPHILSSLFIYHNTNIYGEKWEVWLSSLCPCYHIPAISLCSSSSCHIGTQAFSNVTQMCTASTSLTLSSAYFCSQFKLCSFLTMGHQVSQPSKQKADFGHLVLDMTQHTKNSELCNVKIVLYKQSRVICSVYSWRRFGIYNAIFRSSFRHITTPKVLRMCVTTRYARTLLRFTTTCDVNFRSVFHVSSSWLH